MGLSIIRGKTLEILSYNSIDLTLSIYCMSKILFLQLIEWHNILGFRPKTKPKCHFLDVWFNFKFGCGLHFHFFTKTKLINLLN